MPTTERYAINDLQQAVLDVLALAVAAAGDDDLHAHALHRETLIERVAQVPGQDDVNGNHMGPCLAALKRRGLVEEISQRVWAITRPGVTYADLDGEPLPEADHFADASKMVSPQESPAPVGSDDPNRGPPSQALSQRRRASMVRTRRRRLLRTRSRPAGIATSNFAGPMPRPSPPTAASVATRRWRR